MIQADEKNSRSPADPGTSKIQTKESSSFSAGSITSLSEMEKTMSPTQVASYEYMGTTYYRHEGIDVKPRARTNDDAGNKLLSQGGVAYRSHRTPANFRGRGDSWSGGGGAFWPRKSLLSSFGEADLTHNFKIQQSLATRRNSCNDSKSDYHNGPLYTKSGQPYVPISVANTKWYRTRLASEENRETHKEPICHRGKGSYQDSLVEGSGGKSELANGESNDMMERLLDRDNEFKVEAIEDFSVKDLKCLKLTATSAKALIRIFEPMLKNWKEVVSAVPDTSDEKNVNEDIKENAATSETTFVLRPERKESNKSVEIVPGNENESIILEEMSQKLLGNSTQDPQRTPLPKKHQKDKSNFKNPEVKEELQRKEPSVMEDAAYANSYSPATGLRMIEAFSTVRNYLFTIGDRGEISRVLTPLVKELVVINKIGGKGKECKLEIGVVVESQQQFFGAIKAVNASFKSRGFQFNPLPNFVNGIDVLDRLIRMKVIPKVDCNGMYQITVKFNLPKGNEMKVDESLGKELEVKVRDCRVEKISFGPGERILQLGHIEDMIKASTKIKNVFDIIPSKHIWNNERDKVRNDNERRKRKTLRMKEEKAKVKEPSNRKEGKSKIKEQSNMEEDKAKNEERSNRRERKAKNREQSNGKEAKGKNKEQSNRREEKAKNKEQSTRKEKAKNKERSNRKDEKAENKEQSNGKDEKAKNKGHSNGKEAKVKNKEQSNKVEFDINDTPKLNPMIRQEKEKSPPLLSNQIVTLTLSDSDSTCYPSKIQLKPSAMRRPLSEDRLVDRSEVKTSPLSSLIRFMEGGDGYSDLKLLQDSFVKCPNDNEENENQAFGMLEKVMAVGDDVDDENEMKSMSVRYNNVKKFENGMVVRDGNDKMIKKTINTGDTNQNIQSQDIRKENFQSEREVCQLGEENKLIFESIDESKIDIVKEDTSWYGNVSNFVTIKNSFSLWNVYVIFEAKEATKIAYFGLREKYNGVRAGCEIDI